MSKFFPQIKDFFMSKTTATTTEPITSTTTQAEVLGKVEKLSATSDCCTDQKNCCQEEEIKVKAYLLWEQAGCPESDGTEFWIAAEKELKSNS
jgi:Protein of unknown function (DUF2934)